MAQFHECSTIRIADIKRAGKKRRLRGPAAPKQAQTGRLDDGLDRTVWIVSSYPAWRGFGGVEKPVLEGEIPVAW